MPDKMVRRWLDLVNKPPIVLNPKYLPPDVSTSTFVFSFKCLYSYPKFRFREKSFHKNGKGLVAIFEILIRWSAQNIPSIDTEKDHSHDIEPFKLIENGLDDLVDKFSGKKFFQFGLSGQSERLVGFFNDEKSNIFEVCLLDLNHAIYAKDKKRVFME